MANENHPYCFTVESLSTALMEAHLCDSTIESAAVSAALFQDGSSEESLVESLREYFDLKSDEALVVVRRASDGSGGNKQQSDSTGDDDGSENDNTNEQESLETDDDDDGELIGQGECEFCERHVQLTKHHLIPKSTHARIEPKLRHAAAAIERGDIHRARILLGPGLEHVMESLSDGSSIRHVLKQTCTICRPCHSAVHNTHDNMTLALQYNTVELLVADTAIYKFCQWQHKQKPGKYAVQR